MQQNTNCDIIVIGAGPGGYVAAIRAAQLGAKVLVVEKDEVGGVCLNCGCIPTKALIASVSTLANLKRAKSLGLEVTEARINLGKALERKNRVVEQLIRGIKFLFKKRNIEIIKGMAAIRDKNSVVVESEGGNKQEFKTKKIIIATGSKPFPLPTIPFDAKNVIDSTDALSLKAVPQSMLIIGGGAVGVEFACIFSSLGTKVTLVEMLPHIIPAEDKELAIELERAFRDEKIKVLTSTKVEKVSEEGDRIIAVTSGGEEIVVDKVLVAVGRKLSSENIGLEKIGVKTERGKILVDEKMQTNIADVYAVGDVVGGTLLAHKASMEGIVAAENTCGIKATMDYGAIPSCIYSFPEVASVGMTEDKAKSCGMKVKVGKFPFSASGKAMALGKACGFVKIVAEAEKGTILGVQIIGQHATDLIAEGVLAVKHKLTLEQLSWTVHAHPTLAEALMEAAEAAEGRAIHL